jgi:peroxiredoxin
MWLALWRARGELGEDRQVGVQPDALEAVRWRPCQRKYFGNERTTFVIDGAGMVADVLRMVKPAEHDERALAALLQTA